MSCDPSASEYRKKPWVALPPSLPPTTPHGLHVRGIYRQLPEESKLVNIPVQLLSNATNAGVSPSGFSFFFFIFFKRTSVAVLKLWEVEDYTGLGTP